MGARYTTNEIATSIKGYLYKPAPMFRGDRLANDHLGVEVEVWNERRPAENGKHAARVNRTLKTAYDFLYCKHDGSVPNGFEVVSHPATLQYWNEKKSDMKKMFYHLRRNGFRSARKLSTHRQSSAGMHIHLSRTAFDTAEHLYKFLRLFYSFPKFAAKVGHRNKKDRHWGKLERGGERLIDVARRGRHGNSDRKQAVNLQPIKTVEVRLFNGTLNEITFYRNVQFVHACMAFGKDTPVNDVRPRNFRNWVRQANAEGFYVGQYVELVAYFDKNWAD